jgi:hypothetical protein
MALRLRQETTTSLNYFANPLMISAVGLLVANLMRHFERKP